MEPKRIVVVVGVQAADSSVPHTDVSGGNTVHNVAAPVVSQYTQLKVDVTVVVEFTVIDVILNVCEVGLGSVRRKIKASV